jgi:hypothetical protein
MHTLLSHVDDPLQVLREGRFCANVPAVYAPILRRGGTAVEDWLTYLTNAIEQRTFFGAASFYTCIARRARDE